MHEIRGMLEPVHRRATQTDNHTLTSTLKGQFSDQLIYAACFGLREEATVPGENPRVHQGNMQTPCREGSAGI